VCRKTAVLLCPELYRTAALAFYNRTALFDMGMVKL